MWLRATVLSEEEEEGLGVFIERIAQAVCLKNRPCKLVFTDGSHKETTCVNGALTQAVSLCEPPVKTNLHKWFFNLAIQIYTTDVLQLKPPVKIFCPRRLRAFVY